MRRCAERPDHARPSDFIEGRTHGGRQFRMLRVIDEFIREAPAIRVKRKRNSTEVLETPADPMILREAPAAMRSDNGPQLIARARRGRIAVVGSRTIDIEPGSPWKNGCGESFNAKLRDGLRNGELLFSLSEARLLVESWWRHYDAGWPYSALDHSNHGVTKRHPPTFNLDHTAGAGQRLEPGLRQRQSEAEVEIGVGEGQ